MWNFFSQTASFEVSDVATYSASVVEFATHFCLTFIQLITPTSQGEHTTGCRPPRILIWHKVRIRIAKWNQILSTENQHMISSAFQVLNYMLNSCPVGWIQIWLVFANHAYNKTDIMSRAHHDIHETFYSWNIKNRSHAFSSLVSWDTKNWKELLYV